MKTSRMKNSTTTDNRVTRWTLLTNTADETHCDETAQWYYWRWNIESWLQRSAGAILRRLLIASMAGVLVWRLQRSEGEENARARRLICRLSGRQQKRGRLESAPAPCRIIGPFEYLNVVIRVHAGRTDPLSNESIGAVRRCVDTYDLLSGGFVYERQPLRGEI